ncbi:GNAT family N-acetyltransferase [Aquihabitans sp. McL0605]|uniref:GNAT family N-acetyltransferase n=1 Tax=Aquihabitans sp. McL0605 TaxID=3415671 RepID=UPI003CF4FDFF
MPYPDPPLVGRTVALRPFRADDYGPASVPDPDPEAARWVPPMPDDDGPGVAAHYEECRRDGVLLHLVIADRATDEYLGEVMVAFGEHRVAEVGCVVGPAARGRGVAVEAFGLLVDWALGPLGLARLQVFVAADNPGGLRLSERTGFRREGVLRSYGEHDGGRFDAIVLARLAEDPPPAR